MIRRPPRSTLDRSSAASDVYKRQVLNHDDSVDLLQAYVFTYLQEEIKAEGLVRKVEPLSLIHISEPTRPY